MYCFIPNFGMYILKTLIYLNRTITSRINNNKGYYLFFVGIGCIGLFLIGSFIIFFLKPDDIKSYRTLFSLVLFITIMFDIAMTLLKYSNKSIIELKHFKVYPLSKWEKFKFYSLLILTDYKSCLYLTGIVIFAVFFLERTLITAVFCSIILFILLFLTILIWTITAYHLFGRFFEKHRKNVGAVIMLLFSFFITGLTLLNMLELINSMPIIGYASNALYGFMITDLYLALNSVGLLLVSLFAGLFVYAISPANY